MIRHFLQRVCLGHSPRVRGEHAVDVRPDLDRAVRVASSSKESRPSPLPRFRAPRSQQPPKNGRRVIRAVAFERGRRAVLARCDEAGDDELRADTCRRAVQKRRGLREQPVARAKRAPRETESESACKVGSGNRTHPPAAELVKKRFELLARLVPHDRRARRVVLGRAGRGSSKWREGGFV